MKKFILILSYFTFLAIPACTFAQSKVLEQGEELKYEVYYGFIKLGMVKFKMSNVNTSDPKKTTSNASVEMKSYEGVPLVNISYIFESEMESFKNDLYSKSFHSSEFKNKQILNTSYEFVYDSNFVRMLKESNNKTLFSGNYKFGNGIKLQDGLSLFYAARLHSFDNKNYNIPVFINENQNSVKYSFNINEDVVNIDLVNYDIGVIKIAGIADFTGVFGLTGEFIGWFSDDEYRVPIKAQFNVLIGSVTLELISYKKKNWKPPVFKN
ncbi:hypothetical protein BH10BAC5_BH10BAC5_07780 [soil metagenome]